MAVDELPAEVEGLLDAAGAEWPYLNEGAVRAFVRALRGFRSGMLAIHLDATDSLARIAREQPQEGAEETLEDWDGHAAAYVFGVAEEIEAFCVMFEGWIAGVAADKAAAVERLGALLAGVCARSGDACLCGCVAQARQGAKNVLAELDTKLEGEAGVMFGERLDPLLGRIAGSGGVLGGGTSSLLQGRGTFAPGADLETVYLHIDRFRSFAEAMTACARTLTASMKGLDFGARPGPDDAAGPEPDDEPAEGFAVWRGHRYRAEPVSRSAVRLSLLPGDRRPPVAPELGGWPYTGSLLLWPGQLDAWVGPVPGPSAGADASDCGGQRADLLELWRLRFAEEAFRYFMPVFGDVPRDPGAAASASGSAASAASAVPGPGRCLPPTGDDGSFVVGEFARWRGRLYGAQTMPDDSARLFPLPGDDRTPVVPDLARHARGLWASPIELEEWYAVCTTFYVGDDAYLAVSLADGEVEGLRAYTADPARETFALAEVADLQEERRDLLAEWKWKTGI